MVSADTLKGLAGPGFLIVAAEIAGELLFSSHESLRRDYEVSCYELDLLVELMRDQEEIIGGRMTGAGFGGCAIALVDPEEKDMAAEVIAQMRHGKADGGTGGDAPCDGGDGEHP